MDYLRSISARTSYVTKVPRLYEIFDERVKDIQDIHRHVKTNIKEARRLRLATNELINNEERKWIDGVLADTEEALSSIAQLPMFQSAQPEQSGQADLNISPKAMRIFGSGIKMRDKLARLSACHQSLTAVITCLYQKGSVMTVSVQLKDKREQPPAYDPQLEQLFNWRSRCRREKGSISLGRAIASSPSPEESTLLKPGVEPTFSSAKCEAHEPSKDSTYSWPALADAPSPFTYTTQDITATSHSNPSSSRRGSLSTLPSLGGFGDGSEGRQKSETMIMPPCPSFLGRPRASSVPSCQNNQQPSRPRTSYPMSPSDYMMGSPFEKAKSFKSPLGITVMNSSEDLRQHDEKSQESHTVCSSGRLSKFHLQRDENLQDDVTTRSFEGADGLQLAEGGSPVYLPYRLPFLSDSASSFCLSPPSRPSSSHHVRCCSSLDLPRISTGVDCIPQQSISELGMNSPDTAEKPLVDMPHHSRIEEYSSRPVQQTRDGRKRRGQSWLSFHAARGDLGRSGG